MGVIWLTPFAGTTLYLLLGINRIERHAKRKRRSATVELEPCEVPIADANCVTQAGLRDLMVLGEKITGLPLTANNSVQVLVDGDEAYPAMLSAIDKAERSITLATYIFDRDRVGLQFVEALGRAVARGVQVRVLVDFVGASYHLPTIRRALQHVDVPVAYFLPTLLPWRLHYSNLRNHRKLLVIDGKTAFTGGMNIRQGHQLQTASNGHVRDIQFQIAGPVVGQLQEIFAIDWRFTTGELLSGPTWFECAEDRGTVAARCIADGPDESLDRMRKLLHGAISVARSSIAIITPYFLPDPTLITSLNIAAMRGVKVEIFLPERGNLRFVQWASTSQLWQVLEHGCQVWLTPPPFDHTKLMVVDGEWSLIGSTNWDPRSLRLNFELNVELYSPACALQLSKIIDQRRQQARAVTLQTIDGRPVWRKLRDGVARLFSPYL
jgi:cardiolipin synthase